MLSICALSLLSCNALTSSTSTGFVLRTYPAARIQATWLGSTAGTPDSLVSTVPSNVVGFLCPATSLQLLNHSTTFAGTFSNAASIIVIVGTCVAQISVAICATAGSGGGATTIPTCAADPTQTPASNLQFDNVLGPTREGTTPASFSVNVFWCASGDNFNLGQTGAAASTDCVAP